MPVGYASSAAASHPPHSGARAIRRVGKGIHPLGHRRISDLLSVEDHRHRHLFPHRRTPRSLPHQLSCSFDLHIHPPRRPRIYTPIFHSGRDRSSPACSHIFPSFIPHVTPLAAATALLNARALGNEGASTHRPPLADASYRHSPCTLAPSPPRLPLPFSIFDRFQEIRKRALQRAEEAATKRTRLLSELASPRKRSAPSLSPQSQLQTSPPFLQPRSLVLSLRAWFQSRPLSSSHSAPPLPFHPTLLSSRSPSLPTPPLALCPALAPLSRGGVFRCVAALSAAPLLSAVRSHSASISFHAPFAPLSTAFRSLIQLLHLHSRASPRSRRTGPFRYWKMWCHDGAAQAPHWDRPQSERTDHVPRHWHCAQNEDR